MYLFFRCRTFLPSLVSPRTVLPFHVSGNQNYIPAVHSWAKGAAYVSIVVRNISVMQMLHLMPSPWLSAQINQLLKYDTHLEWLTQVGQSLSWRISRRGKFHSTMPITYLCTTWKLPSGVRVSEHMVQYMRGVQREIGSKEAKPPINRIIIQDYKIRHKNLDWQGENVRLDAALLNTEMLGSPQHQQDTNPSRQELNGAAEESPRGQFKTSWTSYHQVLLMFCICLNSLNWILVWLTS